MSVAALHGLPPDLASKAMHAAGPITLATPHVMPCHTRRVQAVVRFADWLCEVSHRPLTYGWAG
jgi:hypothetical protein